MGDPPPIQRIPSVEADMLQASLMITSMSDVIKGLIENSIDAEATEITIKVNVFAGNCSVEDNGFGITPNHFYGDGSLLARPNTIRLDVLSSALSDASPVQLGTSKAGLENVHGRFGNFLYNLAVLSELAIGSRAEGFNSCNAIVIRKTKVVERCFPAPYDYEPVLLGAVHGTKVTVSRLFEGIPVRVKELFQRGHTFEQARAIMVQLKEQVMRTMFAQNVKMRFRLMDGLTKDYWAVGRDGNRLENKALLSVPRFQGKDILMPLTQAGLIGAEAWCQWVPASVKSAPFKIYSMVSLAPASSKKIQYISYGITALKPDGEHEPLFDTVNSIMKTCSFTLGLTEEETAGQQSAKARVRAGQWPMFAIWIYEDNRPGRAGHSSSVSTDPSTLVELRILQNSTRLKRILTLLVKKWISEGLFRPHKPIQRSSSRLSASGGRLSSTGSTVSSSSASSPRTSGGSAASRVRTTQPNERPDVLPYPRTSGSFLRDAVSSSGGPAVPWPAPFVPPNTDSRELRGGENQDRPQSGGRKRRASEESVSGQPLAEMTEGAEESSDTTPTRPFRKLAKSRPGETSAQDNQALNVNPAPPKLPEQLTVPEMSEQSKVPEMAEQPTVLDVLERTILPDPSERTVLPDLLDRTVLPEMAEQTILFDMSEQITLPDLLGGDYGSFGEGALFNASASGNIPFQDLFSGSEVPPVVSSGLETWSSGFWSDPITGNDDQPGALPAIALALAEQSGSAHLVSSEVLEHATLPGQQDLGGNHFADDAFRESDLVDFNGFITQDISALEYTYRSMPRAAPVEIHSSSSDADMVRFLLNWRNTSAEQMPSTTTGYKCRHEADLAKAFMEASGNPLSRNYKEVEIPKRALELSFAAGQIDSKYLLLIAGPTEGFETPADTFVAIDQHAADERIRLEIMLNDLCSPAEYHFEVIDSLGQRLRSQVRFHRLRTPIVLTVTALEHLQLKTCADMFGSWGIIYDAVPRSNLSVGETVIIYTLPTVISERCRRYPSLVLEIFRIHLSENGFSTIRPPRLQGLTMLPTEKRNGNKLPAWVHLVSQIPTGILNLINSRACRGALMFNEYMKAGGSIKVVTDLAKCVFPFHCAHGRPSTVAVVEISADKMAERNKSVVDTECPGGNGSQNQMAASTQINKAGGERDKAVLGGNGATPTDENADKEDVMNSEPDGGPKESETAGEGEAGGPAAQEQPSESDKGKESKPDFSQWLSGWQLP